MDLIKRNKLVSILSICGALTLILIVGIWGRNSRPISDKASSIRGLLTLYWIVANSIQLHAYHKIQSDQESLHKTIWHTLFRILLVIIIIASFISEPLVYNLLIAAAVLYCIKIRSWIW